MKLQKTEAGQAAFKGRSVLISARQRAAFIFFDGKKTVAEVLQSTSGIGVTQEDVDYLRTQGFLEIEPAAYSSRPVPLTARETMPAPLAPAAAPTPAPEPERAGNERTLQERYQEGKAIATRLTASLGLRGLMLNLSVESASGYQELLALLPKIQSAVGKSASRELDRILRD